MARFDEVLRVLNQGEYLNLEEPRFLIAVAGLLIGAFLIAFYNDTGLAALIRDLLLKHSYRSAKVITYGQMYFKPALLFKGSFYIVAGFVVRSDVAGVTLHLLNTRFSDLGMDSDRAVCASAVCCLYQSPLTRNEVYRH